MQRIQIVESAVFAVALAAAVALDYILGRSLFAITMLLLFTIRGLVMVMKDRHPSRWGGWLRYHFGVLMFVLLVVLFFAIWEISKLVLKAIS